jgi:Holliday junction resolvase RusA-like endonuclease
VTPLLHVRIPGEPHSWERVGWNRGRSFDPNREAKKAFQWQVKAASPNLRPATDRLAVILTVWTKKGRVKTAGDCDNFLKFCLDALNGLVWMDDSLIDDARVIVHRGALEPATEILVWELRGAA